MFKKINVTIESDIFCMFAHKSLLDDTIGGTYVCVYVCLFVCVDLV